MTPSSGISAPMEWAPADPLAASSTPFQRQRSLAAAVFTGAVPVIHTTGQLALSAPREYASGVMVSPDALLRRDRNRTALRAS